MSDVPVFGSYEHRYQNACAEIRRMKSESEAKDQRIAELVAGINRAGGLALQKASHELIRQVLAETLASEDTRKEASRE